MTASRKTEIKTIPSGGKALEALPGYSLRRASAAMRKELATRLEPLDIRQTELAVLALIAAEPGVTQSALGRSLDIERANMVPLVTRLVKRELLRREPVDGRSMGLFLSAAGQTLHERAMAVAHAFETELMARIPEEHRAHFLPALNALWR